MKNIFQEYRKIKDKIAFLEEEKKELELKVMDELDSEGLRDKPTPFGHFFSRGRKVWKYSQEIEGMQKALLDAKHDEEAEGVATLSKVTSYIQLVTKGGE